MNKNKFVFFGTPRFATLILEELEQAGLTPALIVTAPDRPKGRGLVLTSSEVKVWALSRHIPLLTPEKIRDNDEFLAALQGVNANFFVVAAYGKIIPKRLLDIAPNGTLNVHPSLLPKFRGSSPVESAILSNEAETGVSIMLLDEEMDHGPILTQTGGIPLIPPPSGTQLTDRLASLGGALLAKTIPAWVDGSITAVAQHHELASFTKKITKEDGELFLDGDALQNFKKFRALDGWPGTYFFIERDGKKMRIKITAAEMVEGKFCVQRVIPEGKKEISYDEFLRQQP